MRNLCLAAMIRRPVPGTTDDQMEALTWRSLTAPSMWHSRCRYYLHGCHGRHKVLEGAMMDSVPWLRVTISSSIIRPLDRLGHLYRTIKKALVDLEQMMNLLAIQPEIIDSASSLPCPPAMARSCLIKSASPTTHAGQFFMTFLPCRRVRLWLL